LAAPTRITDISTTAASNSPTGTEAVGTGLDEYLRAIQTVYRLDLASKGADIASASTADLGAIGGLMHDITGTTAITGFGTVAAGIWKIIKFEGALTLTHNATSLILPGGANITTADGDIAVMISEGSGNWRCVSYFKASGLAVKQTTAEQGASLVLIERQAASGASSVDFDSGLDDATYNNYVLYINAVVPQTDNTNLLLRTDSDSGASYDAGANDYSVARVSVSTSVGTTGTAGATESGIKLNESTLGTASGESFKAVITFDLGSSDRKPLFGWKWEQVDSAGALYNGTGSGCRNSAAAIDAIRLQMSSGNINGNFALYGVKIT
jgi:hypothetical protein